MRLAEKYLSFVKLAKGYYSNYPVVAPFQDNGGQYFNVKAYGAKGDGVTDDTASIKSAFAAAAAGGTIFFPPGTYLVTSSITIISNTTIQGAGMGATVITCPPSMSTPIFTIVMTLAVFLHDWCIRDLTMNGASGAATRGIQIDSSASAAITYFNNLIEHCTFTNFYLAVYHGANNANAGAMYNNTSVSYCNFIANAFGYVFKGSYCEWIDHCYFRNNTQCAILTPGAFSAPPITGSTPGAGPTSAVKITNTDVQNTVANYTSGTENGIIVGASNSLFEHIFVSLVSQCAMVISTSESGLDNRINDISIYGSGSGIILNGVGVHDGGTLTNFCFFSTSQKTNWSGYVSRQTPLDIMSGEWKIENGNINHSLLGPTSVPPYLLYIADSGPNNTGLISLRKVSITNGYATALKHDSPFSQTSLNLIIRDCPGINPDKVYDAGNVTGAVTFKADNGIFIRATLTANIAVTLPDAYSFGDSLTLCLIQDSTGSRTVTWPANFKKANGALTLSTAANAIDTIDLRWDGVNWVEQSRSLNAS